MTCRGRRIAVGTVTVFQLRFAYYNCNMKKLFLVHINIKPTRTYLQIHSTRSKFENHLPLKRYLTGHKIVSLLPIPYYVFWKTFYLIKTSLLLVAGVRRLLLKRSNHLQRHSTCDRFALEPNSCKSELLCDTKSRVLCDISMRHRCL